MCRPYGACVYHANVYPPLSLHFVQGKRDGLRSFVPDGTGERLFLGFRCRRVDAEIPDVGVDAVFGHFDEVFRGS
jgi:hypothetical protein